MPSSLFDAEVSSILDPSSLLASGARLTPSPADWRDHWIYFLLVDRFNNPTAPPMPDSFPCDTYQGGSFAGIKEKLPYLRDLGVGALWLSPVLFNPQWFGAYWGGYGITDFLRVEPRFCSDPQKALQDPREADRELRELIDAAHDQGLYIILDIVLNHVGDPFNYEGMRDACPWRENGEYSIYWRDDNGTPQGGWTAIETIHPLSREIGVWPKELQHNDYFRRKGSAPENGDITRGDFSRLKELVTEYLEPGSGRFPVRDALIRAYQYLIGKFDLDGYRIDTLQYVESNFARIFGNAMREYALSIGKHNFFTFGEVWQDDNEEAIARFVGRNTLKDEDVIGVDAAIDFPMRKRLKEVIKCQAAPSVLAEQFDKRRRTLRTIVSSQGDAGKTYVTFLDNHDLDERFHQSQWPRQSRTALLCLLTMQGVPCLYYGHEQGLEGSGNKREFVRGALWGTPGAFSSSHPLYTFLRDLSRVRRQQPALRYGRQYFRPIGDASTDSFGYSPYPQGVLAFSRILNDREVLVVVNTHTTLPLTVSVVVDASLHPVATPGGLPAQPWRLLFSSADTAAGDPSPLPPSATRRFGATHAVVVSLQPMEAQILTAP